MERRTMPVCLTREQHRLVREFARRNGMLNEGQALESILG